MGGEAGCGAGWRGEWVVDGGSAGLRVDVFLARALGVSRGAAKRLLDSGAATVDGRAVRASHILREGERVAAEPPPPTPSEVAAEPIPLSVVYEDEDLLVIDKPRGMVVHPAPGSPSGTLVNAVLAHAGDLSGIGGELRPGIVHRLDKDTSGLLVVAKTDAAHLSLQAQIQAKTAEREYVAVVWGRIRPPHLVIDVPIGRHRGDRKKMAVHGAASRPAQTEIRVVEELGPFSVVEARLRTGRTHQIRVHCAWIGHPVVGDRVYAGQRRVPAEGPGGSAANRRRVEEAIQALGGQALHARRLAFDHPRKGTRMEFTAPLPRPLRDLLETLRSVYGVPER